MPTARSWNRSNSSSESAAAISKHRVGTHEAGVDHVELAHGEVLADHRQAARIARLLEVGDRPAEVRLVREHRQACRTAGLVRRGQCGRVEPDVQITLRR